MIVGNSRERLPESFDSEKTEKAQGRSWLKNHQACGRKIVGFRINLPASLLPSAAAIASACPFTSARKAQIERIGCRPEKEKVGRRPSRELSGEDAVLIVVLGGYEDKSGGRQKDKLRQQRQVATSQMGLEENESSDSLWEEMA